MRKEIALVGILAFAGIAGYKCNEDSQEYQTPNGYRGAGYSIKIEDQKVRVQTFQSWAFFPGDTAVRGLEKLLELCGPIVVESYSRQGFVLNRGRTIGSELIARVDGLNSCIKK